MKENEWKETDAVQAQKSLDLKLSYKQFKGTQI